VHLANDARGLGHPETAARGPQPEPSSADPCGPNRTAACGEGGPLHGSRGPPPSSSAPEGFAPRAQLLPSDHLAREGPQPLVSSS
jgi:hypothetical protein